MTPQPVNPGRREFVVMVIVIEVLFIALAWWPGWPRFDPLNLFSIGVFVLPPVVGIQLVIAALLPASRREFFNAWRAGRELADGPSKSEPQGCLAFGMNLLGGLVISALIAIGLSFVLHWFLK